MPDTHSLALLPPLAKHGEVKQLIQSGQTISSTWSPLSSSLAVFLTNSETEQSHQMNEVDGAPVYFASVDKLPSAERRLFITDTMIIFAALQNLKQGARTQNREWLQSVTNVASIRKLSIDYINFIKECWVHASQPNIRTEGSLQLASDHYRSLYTCFTLFLVICLPEPGYENAPIGDDLMEWLNTHFIEPSTEEGDHLSALSKPWEDETFWPYLTRTILRGLTKASTFFLDVLADHPSEALGQVTQDLKPLLDSQPRLQQFSAERDFAYAHRKWKEKVKTLRIEMDGIPEDERQDAFADWWDRISDIVGILEGRSEVLQRVAAELGADWKEVCSAWSIFIDVRMRRQDLPLITAQILEDMPVDETDKEDLVHVKLFAGETAKALDAAADLDPWLAGHLADIVESLGVLEDASDENKIEMSIRDHHVLSYAEYLHSDPSLWRVTVSYMYSCEHIGKLRADQVLLRVPLQLNDQNMEGDGAIEGKIKTGEVVGVLKQVNQICFENSREEVRRTVCRVAAQTLLREKEYGLAVSYCSSAEDWPGLGRIVDQVLEEFIGGGPTLFARYAADIAPSLHALASQRVSSGIFLHRLLFVVRYSQFHGHIMKRNLQDAAINLIEMFNGDVVPKSWWAVLLLDAVDLLQPSSGLLFSTSGASELLQKLEEIVVRSSQGSGQDYLAILMRKSKLGSEGEALQQLNLVRFALARYFARCTVIGVGGKLSSRHP